MNKGLFITFEGGEGSGKSTQANLLAQYAKSKGFNVVFTREPGGTKIGEQLRNIVVKEQIETIDPLTETLIFLAARANHWKYIIQPALEQNKIVICDRFQDSTIVYQGIAQGVNIKLINEICKNITNDVYPNRTYLLDIDPEIGLLRSLSRENEEIRFEHKHLEYHKLVRNSYLKIASLNKNYLILDASQNISNINKLIIEDFNTLLE